MITEAYVELTQGLLARVDPDDLDELAKHKWYAARMTSGKYYALTRHGYSHISMHRLLAGFPLEVDHRNLDTLDNRRSNLRSCTRTLNQANKPMQRNNTTGFRGVYAVRGKWRAKVSYSGVDHHLGYYATREDAAKAYDNKAAELFGEFARLNFATSLLGPKNILP